MIYHDEEIWVTIFATKFVAKVDPITGRVLGWLDLSDIAGDRLVALGESFNKIGIFALADNPSEIFEINL